MPSRDSSNLMQRPQRFGSLATSVALLALGCSTTIAARRPVSESALTEINETVEGRSAKVTLAGDAPARPPEAKNIHVGRDSTEWLELSPDGAESRRSIPTAALQQITVRGPGRGAAEGFGLGLLAAPAAGLVFGLLGAGLAGPDPSCHCNEAFCCPSPRLEGFIVGGLIGLVSSLVVGPVVGAVVGHRTTVEFDPPVTAGSECGPEAATAKDTSGAALECRDVLVKFQGGQPWKERRWAKPRK